MVLDIKVGDYICWAEVKKGALTILSNISEVHVVDAPNLILSKRTTLCDIEIPTGEEFQLLTDIESFPLCKRCFCPKPYSAQKKT